jgi:hypothetical protein
LGQAETVHADEQPLAGSGPEQGGHLYIDIAQEQVAAIEKRSKDDKKGKDSKKSHA